MAGKSTPVVYITANVGSIFEEPSVMLKIWTQEFLSTIARLDPKFVALHCQEVGGKNYEKSMKHVEDFVQLLVNSDELRLFDKARIYLDEDYSSAENFTALGNFYFIHESIKDALIYDFEQRRFVEVSGQEVYSKNIENIGTKEKSKFPLEYFPECKWSRKGFLRTRWCLNGTVFDLVNIHLFHDVSNFVAIKSFPSVYSDTRRRALAYTLERFQTDEYGPVPVFLFGDFNFRTDTQGVVKHLSEGLNTSDQEDELSVIQFKQEDKVVLSLGKKEFSHSDHQSLFTSKDGDWLREFDKELKAFSDQLFEFEISFPPSYPFEEDSSGDRCYMKTRCPAWCDRVVLSHSAIPLVKGSDDPTDITYSIMGRNTCMGDHKPVYLKFDIQTASAKSKRPEGYTSPDCESREKVNGLGSATETEDKSDSGKRVRSGLKYTDVEIEKLACSLEALMSQNSNFCRQQESNVEPDISKCTSCRMNQAGGGRAVNNAGGEEIAVDSLPLDDKNMIALLASEIKVPDNLIKKIEIQDTGQKGSKETFNWNAKSNGDKAERFGAVKRVNSASFAEQPTKKEDWKNTRCNSDVSWSASRSIQSQSLAKTWKSSKQFIRGNSRIRLISSSNSLNASLPRLTSHHSSSDEEWFEEIEEGDDDVLRMSDDKRDGRVNESEEDEQMDTCPEYCGDREATAGTSKPATQSVSRTNLLLDENGLSVPRGTVAGTVEVPSDTASCLDVSPEPGLRVESVSFTGKSIDGVLRMDEARARGQRHTTKMATSQSEKDSKFSLKGSKAKSLRLFKRLTEGRKESHGVRPEQPGKSLADSTNRESFETLIVDPTVTTREGDMPEPETALEAMETPSERPSGHNFNSEMGDVRQTSYADDKATEVTSGSEFWETIELGGKKSRDKDKRPGDLQSSKTSYTGGGDEKRRKCVGSADTNCCCILQ